MYEFLKNTYFVKEKSYYLKENVLTLPDLNIVKGKSPSFTWKISWKISKCLNFWGISALLKKNPLKMSEFLKNKYFFNEKSHIISLKRRLSQRKMS
jgi:hypothetical protein